MGLTGAYLRRKRREGALLFGGAMELIGKVNQRPKPKVASLGQLAMLGFGIKGATEKNSH